MRNLIITTFLVLAFGLGVNAQCVETPQDPCVSVRQSTLDRAAKALDELISARDLIEKQITALKATDAERKAWVQYQATTESTIAIFQKGLVDREKVIELQDKVIQTLVQLNDKLLTQLNKPKSAWSKFADAIKAVVYILAGAAIRGGI